MSSDENPRLKFLRSQFQECGGKVEIDQGYWALFAIESADLGKNALVVSMLEQAPFGYASGESHDEKLMIYFVDTEHRQSAILWFEDQITQAAGEIREVSPEHLKLVDEVCTSEQPHRAARKLAELHDQGIISAGLVRTPLGVRQLLDRLHAREPLYYSSFYGLMKHQLIDMLELFRQLITEDIGLFNEIIKGALSRDPFLQSRQDATGEIRNFLIGFHIINPMDQMKNVGIANPYTAYLEIAFNGDEILAPIDGIKVPISRSQFLHAIYSIRRNMYVGESFQSFHTQSPWVTEEIAYPFKFIKQLLAERSDLAPLDALYMLERAVAE